ncbi:MAG: DinB family protein [Phycisphaerales bacterium]
MGEKSSVLADGIEASRMATELFFTGFDDSNRTSQAPGLPNHFAWTIGHLAFVMHRAAERFDGAPLPDSDFVPATRGDASRFGIEGVAKDSVPTADASAYPSDARSREIFAQAATRLITAVRTLSDDKLNTTTKWGPREMTLAALASRMSFHNGFHAGQMASLRKALGMKGML